MDDSKAKGDFPEQEQRYAFCVNTYEDSDFTASINEEEFYYYELAEYEDWGETVSTAKMEDYLFSTPEGAIEKSKEIGFDGEIHDSTLADGTKLYSPAKTEDEFITWYRKNDSDAEEELSAAEYKGRKVKLNKPFRTQGGPKKFAVYVQNSSGRVIIVRFGDPNMEIKRDDPKRRKAFRDRHDCANKKDKTTAGYWSCRQWSTNKVEADNMEEHEAKEKPCCNSCAESAVAAEPKPSADETHDEYMSRCQEGGYSEDECMSAHQGHEFKEKAAYHDDEEKKASCASECGIGEELIGGECVRVAVTCEIKIDSIETRIEASTGETVMKISGVAFHDGVNKNSWGIRPALAKKLVDEMVGADVTLNHPKAEMGRFTRNMNGGVDEANVGVVTEASYQKREDGYIVRYAAEVSRPELFAALESGLWMRPDYGVSIGGTGIPSEIIEATEEGGRPTMWFADDFEFDHLAIVHRPAYSEANIETVERVKADETFKCQAEGSDNQPKVEKMSDEIMEDVSASEVESLRAELVLREAKIAEFEAAEVARAEEARLGLVATATEMGLKGHDEFTSETLTTLIASWEASRPVVEEPAVEMTPAVPASSEPVEASESDPVVANYLNGKLIESPEALYARCYNSWAKAYNTVMVGETKAKMFENLE